VLSLRKISNMLSQMLLLVFSRMVSAVLGGNVSAGNYVLREMSQKRGGFLTFILTMAVSDYLFRDIFGGLTLLSAIALYSSHLGVWMFYQKCGKYDGFRNHLTTVWTGAFIFYLISNFGVYVSGFMYPMNFEGFVMCYIMGLPFLVRPLLADLFFVSLQHSHSFSSVWRDPSLCFER